MGEVSDRLKTALSDRYAIEREVGAGGMATVYLARDLRHDRKVALKVLRPELAAVLGTERFLTEIRTTANLQHPHLLPLFDSGEADGQLFYVMPYVAGESLRARLDRERQLPVDEALRIAAAVASALDYAHRQGVIHRDLKPENILLHDGHPLVADFGIALAVSNAGGARITQTGLSLGTPAYMSPEQATGDRTVDARADIYSLGALTYEMLTGEPPHHAPTSQAVIAKLLTERPAGVRGPRPSVPEHVEDAIQRALEKLPADRWDSAKDFADVLGGRIVSAKGHGFGIIRSDRIVAPWRSWSATVAAAALMAIVAVVGLAGIGLGKAIASPAGSAVGRAVRFPLTLEEQIYGWEGRQIVISPDGGTIAYTAWAAEGPQLFVQRTDELGRKGRAIQGTLGANNPFFSPDSEWLGFVDQEGIKRVRLDGSQVMPVVREERAVPDFAARVPEWGADDTIRYEVAGRIMQVSASGGTPSSTLALDSADVRWPHLLPNRRGILFTVGNSETWVLDLRTRESTRLIVEGVDARYVAGDAGGFLIYGHFPTQSVMAVSFDLAKLEPQGSPVTVLSNVSVSGGGLLHLTVSGNGTAVYAENPGTDRRLVIVGPGNDVDTLALPPTDYWNVRFSPNGRQIAYASTPDLYVHDLVTGSTRKLFEGFENAVYPVWSADGRSLIAAAARTTIFDRDVYHVSLDRPETPELLVGGDGNQHPMAWSSNGRYLVYDRLGEQTGVDLHFLTLDADSARSTPYLTAAWNERAAALSPNGAWLAYESDESGRSEIYVRSFPVPGDRIPISTEGGTEPRWSRDGRSIFFRSRSGWLVAARVDRDGTFTVQRREQLLDVRPYVPHPYATFANYDVHPSGDRFLMVSDGGSSNGGSSVTVVVNWLQELEQRVFAGNAVR